MNDEENVALIASGHARDEHQFRTDLAGVVYPEVGSANQRLLREPARHGHGVEGSIGAASVEPKGVRVYIEIKKATLEFSIFYRGIAHQLLSFWLLDFLIVMRDYYFRKLTTSLNQQTHSFQAPLLPELELLLAVHPVAAVTVGLVL